MSWFMLPLYMLLHTGVSMYTCLDTYLLKPVFIDCAPTRKELAANAPVVAHIFVHGTRLPGLIFLDHQAAFKHKVSAEGAYVKALTNVRKDERFYDDQIMQEEGLVEVSTSIIDQCRDHQLPAHLCKRAAVNVITCYDGLIDKTAQMPRYYTYGWVGVLDDKFRQRDAKHFYQTLVNLRTHLQQEFPSRPIKFVLHGHSHGGNVILYLAKYEQKYKQNLVIDYALLYGTPIQAETAHYCLTPTFKNIAIFYSCADKVQISDIFSTRSKTSNRLFSDFVDLQKSSNGVQEVCTCAQGNAKAFGHADFFYLNEFKITRIRRGIRPHHHVYQALNPLPLVLFAPIYMELLQEAQEEFPDNHNFTLNFSKKGKELAIAVQDQDQYIQSDDIGPITREYQDHLNKYWKPYTKFDYFHKTTWMLKTAHQQKGRTA